MPADSDVFVHVVAVAATEKVATFVVNEALVDLSIERDMPLNLGGGISAGDPLEEFKRGFANREQPWHTSEIVCDADAYARLSAAGEPGGFFPAYRARG